MDTDRSLRDWIDAICQQFSRATRWPLSFVANGEGTSAAIHGETQWRAELTNGTQTVGALCLGQPRPRDESYLQACEFAELTARLVERALSERAARELLRVRPVNESPSKPRGGVTVTIDQGPREDQSMLYVDRLLRMVTRQSGFPAAALFLLKRGTDQLNLYAQRVPEWLTVPHVDRSLAKAPIDNRCLRGETIIFNRPDSPEDVWSWLPDVATTGVCHPIAASGENLGTLWLYDRRDRRLTLRDRHVIESTASRLAELIERFVLLNESERSQRLRVELQVAARTQPSAKFHHGRREEWFELAGHSQTSEEVGGDLFEVIPLDDDRLFVAIGDAAGHSIPAALVMACVRGAIRAILDPPFVDHALKTSLGPHDVLRRLNSVLHGLVNSHQFMTMFCAIIDRQQMHIEYASAGHPPMLLIHQGESQLLGAHGLVMGVLDDATYVSTIVPLAEGDLLALSTDGVTEAVDSQQNMFGSDGIAELLIQHQWNDALSLADCVWNALQDHLSVDTSKDDRTLAVLRINSLVSSPPLRPVELMTTGT
ncbi:MAG: serine/threonine-protein phosphatase [Planctomycetaceae bacterium]|nr:serine/threonine-protein phosphatase [Planctomycetaceae bacterium]